MNPDQKAVETPPALLNVTLSVGRSQGRWLMVLAALALFPMELESETLTLSTLFPSPVGIYSRLITTGQGGPGSNTLLARDAGRVGIGIDPPTEKLHVNGNIRVAGTIKGLVDPVNGDEAASKAYVDALGGAEGFTDTCGPGGCTTALLTCTGSKRITTAVADLAYNGINGPCLNIAVGNTPSEIAKADCLGQPSCSATSIGGIGACLAIVCQ